MNQLKFRTNAKCSGCTAKIDAELSKLLPAASWSFDLSSPDRTLTVAAGSVTADRIAAAVETAGYRAELLPGDPGD